ncbi:Uncharacterised protein [Bordetella ansorpii]|uniref:Uncharacterized protein n=1 Tax=Bordetella ansorpii TaxID=288768 RepID=A0A157RBV6_9BORD|nr:hypothetical protein [Bordetella ansorpii]SAI55488.1 Uncharacterised protein [Bordetella ansorpii]
MSGFGIGLALFALASFYAAWSSRREGCEKRDSVALASVGVMSTGGCLATWL